MFERGPVVLPVSDKYRQRDIQPKPHAHSGAFAPQRGVSRTEGWIVGLCGSFDIDGRCAVRR